MTPERIEELATWACMGTKVGYPRIMEMLAEIERLQRENGALRRGQGNYEGKQS